MSDRPPHGILTRDIGRELKAIIKNSGKTNLAVYYDHGERGESQYAIPYFNSYSSGTTLANVDITITSNDEIVLLCEIEEREAHPKHIIGDIDNIFVADGINIGGKPYNFHNAVFIFGLLAKERGKGKEKATALCSKVPSIVNQNARKGIEVIPIIETDETSLAKQLMKEICRRVGIETPIGVNKSRRTTGNVIVDFIRATDEIEKEQDVELRDRLARGYLETANNDIQAVEILHGSEMYALSTYHLQQAAEKLTKAYLLKSNIMSVSAVRSTGHDPLSGFIKLIELMKPIIDVYPLDHKIMQTGLADLINVNENRIQEVALMSDMEIKSMMSILDIYSMSSPQVQRAISSITTNKVESMTQGVAEELGIADESLKATINEPGLIEKSAEEVVTSIYETIALYILSGITFPHEAFTRYSNNETINPSDYAPSLGIVTTTPLLLKHLKIVAGIIQTDLNA